jgi:hypothetical protein
MRRSSGDHVVDSAACVDAEIGEGAAGVVDVLAFCWPACSESVLGLAMFTPRSALTTGPLAAFGIFLGSFAAACGGVTDEPSAPSDSTSVENASQNNSSARANSSDESIVATLPSPATGLALNAAFLFATTARDPLPEAKSPSIRGGVWSLAKSELGVQRKANLLYTAPEGQVVIGLTADAENLFFATSAGTIERLPVRGGQAQTIQQLEGQVESLADQGSNIAVRVRRDAVVDTVLVPKSATAMANPNSSMTPSASQAAVRSADALATPVADAQFVYSAKGNAIVRASK